MRRVIASRSVGRPAAAGGFTLVELVTAASLMTVMMLGVVQIFSIITQTAAEADGMHFAHQQLRATFDRLNRDIRGMSREGYLKIVRRATGSVISPSTLPPYHSDTLAFVTVGPCVTQWASPAYSGMAAEVVYTSNVRTWSQPLEIKVGNKVLKTVDERHGILARGQWMLAGKSGGTAGDQDDRAFSSPASQPTYLCHLFGKQPPLGGTSVDRLAQVGSYVTVWPWVFGADSASGTCEKPESLKRVMASCVSQFFVEFYDTSSDTFKNETKSWYWSTASTTSEETWPRAIRVTIAVHDPSDVKPWVPLNPPPPTNANMFINMFRGYVLQETFWLGDP